MYRAILRAQGRTKQQNETKCNKTNKIQQNTKIFVVAQQNNKKFCSFTTKQQNILSFHNKTTKYFVPKQQNNNFFCFYTTKQQNILLVQNKTTKIIESNSTKQQNILLLANMIFCWFIDYPYQHRAQIHLVQIDILYIAFINFSSMFYFPWFLILIFDISSQKQAHS